MNVVIFKNNGIVDNPLRRSKLAAILFHLLLDLSDSFIQSLSLSSGLFFSRIHSLYLECFHSSSLSHGLSLSPTDFFVTSVICILNKLIIIIIILIHPHIQLSILLLVFSDDTTFWLNFISRLNCK